MISVLILNIDPYDSKLLWSVFSEMGWRQCVQWMMFCAEIECETIMNDIRAVLIFDISQILSKILCSNEIHKMLFTSHSGFHLLSSRSYWSWFWNMFWEESCFAQQLKIKHILLTWMDITQVPLETCFPIIIINKKRLPVYCWKLHVVVCHCCAIKNPPDLSLKGFQ